MQDLTQGSIPKHLIKMAIPMAIGMFIQTLYVLVDLYFVSQLGEQALAGVSAAANLSMVVLALTQVLNVGTGTLIAQAVGRKDQSDANLVFNQTLLIAVLMTFFTLIMGYGFSQHYMQSMSQDAEVVAQGNSYLYWFLPNLALQFLMVGMAAAMRGTGIVKPAMQVQMLTVVINTILTPILINGWFTGHAMGVAGAGLASSVSMAIGLLVLWRYFIRLEHYVSFDSRLCPPNAGCWRRLLFIGIPAGTEFFLMFLYMALVYWAIQGFGASATAGFGLGSRVMQALLLPAMAVAFALPAVAGQNFGAELAGRVKDTFRWSLTITSLLMAGLTLICLWFPETLVSFFSDEPAVLMASIGFLGIICWNFVPSAIIFSCSGLFQGMGNTWPGLWSAGTRLFTFALPLVWLTHQPDFQIEQVWQLSVATVILQAMLSFTLLRKQLRTRLVFNRKTTEILAEAGA